MQSKEHIVRSSAKEISRRIARGESKTDWRRVKAMSQAEVEHLADEEEGPLPEGWESTVEIGVPEPKQAVHIRLDRDVVRWFKEHGPGYQTRINAVLKAFVAARQRAER
ncbi:MAG TPA: BrnA antitoxin family protein [Candidatus Binataceae bacterium]|jgi:uncharacterized protein (DUF4415 family)|nr:BrnA antitoxin family protein [Candidatus Binataceae bacterium]